VIFSVGLVLTAGVGGALAHHVVDGRASARTPLQDDSGCGAQKDAGGENDDSNCDDDATGSADSIDRTDDGTAGDMNDEQDGESGETGDNAGDHED
jgi:hypothetical protein